MVEGGWEGENRASRRRREILNAKGRTWFWRHPSPEGRGITLAVHQSQEQDEERGKS